MAGKERTLHLEGKVIEVLIEILESVYFKETDSKKKKYIATVLGRLQ